MKDERELIERKGVIDYTWRELQMEVLWEKDLKCLF